MGSTYKNGNLFQMENGRIPCFFLHVKEKWNRFYVAQKGAKPLFHSNMKAKNIQTKASKCKIMPNKLRCALCVHHICSLHSVSIGRTNKLWQLHIFSVPLCSPSSCHNIGARVCMCVLARTFFSLSMLFYSLEPKAMWTRICCCCAAMATACCYIFLLCNGKNAFFSLYCSKEQEKQLKKW